MNVEERFLELLDTITDYRKIKLTDEIKEEILFNISEDMSEDDIERLINKKLVRFGYEYDINNFVWLETRKTLILHLMEKIEKEYNEFWNLKIGKGVEGVKGLGWKLYLADEFYTMVNNTNKLTNKEAIENLLSKDNILDYLFDEFEEKYELDLSSKQVDDLLISLNEVKAKNVAV
jgi:hypothetical protein